VQAWKTILILCLRSFTFVAILMTLSCMVFGEYHTFLLGRGSESTFLATTKFKGAGKVFIEDGRIIHVSNDTGHLKTSKQGAYNQAGIIRDSGFGVRDITVDASHSPQ
jgi:hypothetical protein